MRNARVCALAIGGVILAAAGCATTEEWTTWKQHPAHFASGSHIGFSVMNRAGTPPQVTRRDVALARDEAWWGKPITVSQEQILER